MTRWSTSSGHADSIEPSYPCHDMSVGLAGLLSDPLRASLMELGAVDNEIDQACGAV